MNLKNIKLTSLLVNTENYRFEPQSSQKEAIDKMIEDQGDKLYVLAVDILKYGLSPVDLIMVTPDENSSRFTVLEGNRRVTTLKLLSNPSLIGDSHEGLRRRFQKISKDNDLGNLKTITCAVFNSSDEADVWIKRKHAGEQGGIGTVTWNAQQKDRFEERVGGKSSIPLQIISFLKNSEIVDDELKARLPELSTTNLQRLVADKSVREKLGIEINSGVLVSVLPQEEIIRGLVTIVRDILSPEFSVSKIYNSEKRKQYIDSLDKGSLPDLTKSEDSVWNLSSANEVAERNSDSIKSNSPKNIRNKGQRKALVPKSFQVDIDVQKICKILEELQTLPIRSCPNAAAILLRVFLEYSVDRYIDLYGLNVNNNLTACSEQNLSGKTFRVINHMQTRKVIDDSLSKGIRSELKEKNSVISLDTLNAYVHNPTFYPKADNLIIAWDNIQRFFEILWANINNMK